MSLAITQRHHVSSIQIRQERIVTASELRAAYGGDGSCSSSSAANPSKLKRGGLSDNNDDGDMVADFDMGSDGSPSDDGNDNTDEMCNILQPRQLDKQEENQVGAAASALAKYVKWQQNENDE